MFYRRVLSVLEMDFKKIIALSTLNQIRLIIFSLSLGLKIIVFFHLNSHAFFKSLLFIGAGCLIHYHFSLQDSRIYKR